MAVFDYTAYCNALANHDNRKAVVDFCNQMIAMMVPAIKEEFGPSVAISVGNIKRRYRFDTKFNVSYGGVRRRRMYVSLVLVSPTALKGTGDTRTYPEYDHIANDPVIGSIESADWRKYTAALLAHEVAHAIQYGSQESVTSHYSGKYTSSYVSKDGFCHGPLWQSIYRFLRENFVNNNAYEQLPEHNPVSKRKKNYKVIGSVNVNVPHDIRIGTKTSCVRPRTYKLIEGFKCPGWMGLDYGYVRVLVGTKECRIKGYSSDFEIVKDQIDG